MSDHDPYCYPGTTILRNKFGITDAAELDRIERLLVTHRIVEGVPRGAFDLAHLRDIHRHLFQNVYDWVGEIRTVEIAKGARQFQFRRFIDTGMNDVHRRLARANFLRGLGGADFAQAASVIMGDVNYVHPFRDGNGRAQLLWLEQLAGQAGHGIDLTRLRPDPWVAASRAAHGGDYDPMGAEIGHMLGD